MIRARATDLCTGLPFTMRSTAIPCPLPPWMAMADVADSSTRVVDGCQIEVLAKDTSLFTSRNRQRCGRVFDPKCCARAPLSKLTDRPDAR